MLPELHLAAACDLAQRIILYPNPSYTSNNHCLDYPVSVLISLKLDADYDICTSIRLNLSGSTLAPRIRDREANFSLIWCRASL